MTTAHAEHTETTAHAEARHHHFTHLRIDGFRGHRLEVALGEGVTVLTGPNRVGKTSTADALSLVVSGGLPGAPTAKDGLAETDVLAECAPASGTFAIEATDDEGQTVRFRFSQGEKRGWRDVSSSLVDSKKNDDHLAAIAARYGTGGRVLGPVAFDPGKLRSLDGGSFEREILRLCGDRAADWTGARVLSTLAERAWLDVGGAHRATVGDTPVSWRTTGAEAVEEAVLTSAADLARLLGGWPVLQGGQDEDLIVPLASVEDPRRVLEHLDGIVTERLKEARSDVVQRGKELNLPLPETPEAVEVEELAQQRDAAQVALGERQSALGQLRGRLDEVRSGRNALIVRVNDALQAARTDVAEREAALARLQQSGEQDEGRRALLATKITLAEEELKTAQSKHEAVRRVHEARTEPTDEQILAMDQLKAPQRAVAAAHEREATAAAAAAAMEEVEVASPLPEDIDEREAKVAADIATTDAAGLALTEQLGTMKAERAMHEEKAERHAAGQCPECGHETTELRASLEDLVSEIGETIAKISADIAEKRELAARLRDLRKSYQTMRDEHRTATEARAAERRRVEREREGAARALADAERELLAAIGKARAEAKETTADLGRRTAAAQIAVTRIEESIQQFREELAALQDRTVTFADLLNTAEGALIMARQRLEVAVAAEQAAAAAPADDGELTDAIARAESAIEQARAELAAAEEAHAALKGKRDVYLAVLRRRSEAETFRDQARAYSALWRSAQNGLHTLEREVLQSYVAPLVQPVNALLRAAGVLDAYGSLEATFGRRFQLGFRNAAGFAPLSQLSAGHFAMTAVLIVTIAHRLAGSAYRAVQIDNAEAVDRDTREGFLGMLAWLRAQGHLDQVILGAVDVFAPNAADPDGPPVLTWPAMAGVHYLDLRDCKLQPATDAGASGAESVHVSTNNDKAAEAA